MKITSFEISGYWRLFLRGIDYIKYIPQSNVLVVLGSNGSGKSSLVEELSINPADASFYKPGGYKIVNATHRGNQYIFTSHIETKGNVYSIVKNGVELNPGYTVSVYRDIIKKEFKMTKMVHELMIGKRNFHEMSSEERKNWMILLCGVDYTYALAYFNRVKETHRDTVGGIKTIHTRLNAESAKIVDEKEEELLSKEHHVLQGILYKLLELKGTDAVQQPIRINEKAFEKTLMDVKIYKTLMTKARYKGNSEITDDFQRDSIQIEYNVLARQKDELYKQETELSAALTKVRSLHMEDRDQLIEQLEDLKITRQNSLSRLELTELTKLVTSSTQAWSDILSLDRTVASLKHLLGELVSNIDNRYSPTLHRSKQMELSSEHVLLGEQERELQILRDKKAELVHLKVHSRQQCPQCNYIWYKGYSEPEEISVTRQLAAAMEKFKTKRAQIDKLTAYIAECSEYLTNYRSYMQLKAALPESLVIMLEANGYVKNCPEKAIKFIDFYISEMAIVYDYLLTSDKINDIVKLLEEQDKQGNVNVGEISSSIEKLSERLFLCTSKMDVYKNQLDHYKHYRESIRVSDELKFKILDVVRCHKQRRDAVMATHVQDHYVKSINLIKDRMNQIEYRRSQADYQKRLVSDLTEQLNELKEKEIVYEHMLEALSPKTGLIAKGLGSFINHLVGKMNVFIKQFWSYPLEIQAVDASTSVDLDFKFKVKVNDDRVINDPKDGSGAIREIINLAFKIEAAKLLDMGDFPVYLDEFSIRMDHAHREAAYNAIMKLISESNFSQWIMVSHYEQGYSGLNNADFIVLCDRNVIVPDFAKGSKCVSFKKD